MSNTQGMFGKRPAHMRKMALKYCGSCNPQIDLAVLGKALADSAPGLDTRLVPLSEEDIDLVIILCGCPRACGNKAEVRARASRLTLVAGHSVNGKGSDSYGLIPLLLDETATALGCQEEN